LATRALLALARDLGRARVEAADDLDLDADTWDLAASEDSEANGGATEFSADEYFLSEHSPIEEAPSIDVGSAEKLREIGVMRVGDLLTLPIEESIEDLNAVGLSTVVVTAWQAQSRLVCGVPRLRAYDARILVACGITEPKHLFSKSPAELRDLVREIASRGKGQAALMSGTEFELSRVTDWISDHSRQSQSPQRTRVTRRQHAAAEAESYEPDVVKMQSPEAKWQFFLSRDDAVVDAPSIGQRTAERLDQVGIRTVDDLLRADAKAAAKELNNRRISEKVIRQWQQQTELVCRIPQLRGHDAQILVALGVTAPEELAACDPQELWTEVEPFVETKEGKRIIRNGKTPDLEEVTDWIRWAQAARQLDAA